MNFNTWHSNDSIISKYYNSYFGLSSMNSVFIKEYEKGINKVLDDKSRYGIFGLILKYLYNGNRYNNHNPISNLFSVNNAKISFEDCIINFTCGGTIFAFYESPMMLLLYNNIDFGQGFIEPSSEQLYMLGRDLFGRIYLTMKRLYVDLTMDGNPFIKIEHDNPEYSDGEVKSTFVKDCISQFYMLTNNTNNNDSSRKFYSNLMNNDELYDFITIFSQFMDYDFIVYNICNLIDSKVDYRVRGKENKEVINYFNTIRSNRGRDISLFNEYCKNIDMIDNQLNYIINSIIERKIGTIINDNNIDNEKEVIDKYNDSIKELESHKNNINSNYPITIKDSIDSFNILESESNTLFKIYIKFKYIGITKEEYEKLNDNERKEYNEILSSDIVVDYEKAISELEIKLSQLKRMKLLKEGNYEEVIDNPEKEFYDLLSKNPDINLLMYQKLDRIEKKFDSIRDILIDTNHMLRTLIERNVIKESDIEEIIKVDESKTNNESPIDSQIFSNKINDSQFNSDLPVILESKKNNPPCQPYENEDKTTITFFNNLCEKCTVVQDLRFEELSDEEKEKIIFEFDETKHDYYQESLSIEYTENELNSYYSVVNNPRACYDRFLYAPSIYLERYIPKYLNSNNELCGIDIYKALKQEIPLYSVDSSRLLLSFHNIPISFNQKLEFILSDIKERIGINEEDFSQKIIELIEEFKLKDFWNNNDIKLIDRMNLVKGFQDKVNNLK